MKSASVIVEDDFERLDDCNRLSSYSSETSIETLEAILGPGNYKSLSRLSKVSATHVSRVLRGKIGASFEVAQRIADAAGITVHDLRRYIEATKRNGNSHE